MPANNPKRGNLLLILKVPTEKISQHNTSRIMKTTSSKNLNSPYSILSFERIESPVHSHKEYSC
jgi:hypothetical protein